MVSAAAPKNWISNSAAVSAFGAPLEDPTSIPELAHSCERCAANPGKSLIAAHQGIGVNVPQVDLARISFVTINLSSSELMYNSSIPEPAKLSPTEL